MTAVFNYYLTVYVLLFVAGLSATTIRYLVGRGKISVTSAAELNLNYLLVALCLLIPAATLFQKAEFGPVFKIEAAANPRDLEKPWSPQQKSEAVVSVSNAVPAVKTDSALTALGLVLGFSALLGLLKFISDFLKLRSLLGSSFQLRQIGQVRIVASDEIEVPFSSRWLRAWVVVPMRMISEPAKYKTSVLHELQHHRQRDTVWIYVLVGLKILFSLNPLVWIWVQVISEVQELACDENLVDQGKVNRREYASQLIEIAETAVLRKERLVCAAGFAFLNDRQAISRRIESMFQKRRVQKAPARIATISLILGMAATAFASRGLVADHRVTMIEAQQMAAVATKQSDFPVVVNNTVLKQLNRYLGTAQGRNFMKDSIQKMATYRQILDLKLNQYQMPEELLAVAIVESGFQNLPQVENKSWGAGIWMFIESTARNFGLRVTSEVDDRLNVELETDAAMRYLNANHLRFKDWLLAIQAYNSGEQNVQAAMDRFGTRDVWSLVRSGLQGDKDYLAKVMAVILILKNPDSIN